ncbi:MAG: nitroreductase family protein [Anaerovoracaceae bacterium]
MDTIKCIKERRSVRKFKEMEISKDIIEEIVDASRYSPSWKNTQIVRYYAINSDKIKAELAENCILGFEFNGKTINRSKTLMVITTVDGISGFEKDGSYSTPKEDKWEMFDAGIATQTFCLAAKAKGVGTVILGIFDDEKVKKAVGINDNETVAALVAMGYPENLNDAPPRMEVSDILSFR